MSIITKAEAKKLKRPMTIDLKEIHALEYLESKQTRLQKAYYFITGVMSIAGILIFIMTTLFSWSFMIPEASADH
jgi:hypothetical protein